MLETWWPRRCVHASATVLPSFLLCHTWMTLRNSDSYSVTWDRVRSTDKGAVYLNKNPMDIDRIMTRPCSVLLYLNLTN